MLAQFDFTKPVEIVTERLLIRTPIIEDASAMNAAIRYSLPELKNWMIWAQEAPTLDTSRSNLEGAIVKYEAGKDCRLHLFLKDSNIFIGSSGLHFRDKSVPSFEIGYWLSTEFVGNGYVTEAVQGITKFGFEQFGAKRIAIRMDDRNSASWRVAERSGYKLEGILHNDSRATDGSLRSTRVYALTRN